MPAVRAGSLNRRGIIQELTVTRDAAGGQVKSWADLMAVWMSIEPLSGRELALAQQINVEITHQIVIRYNTALADPKAMARRRISFKGRFFNIHSSFNAEEGNVYIQIYASEGLNNG